MDASESQKPADSAPTAVKTDETTKKGGGWRRIKEKTLKQVIHHFARKFNATNSNQIAHCVPLDIEQLVFTYAFFGTPTSQNNFPH